MSLDLHAIAERYHRVVPALAWLHPTLEVPA